MLDIMVGTTVLIVRHLPACLTAAEKTEMLQYFGATEVRVMSCHGRLKHSAFATFADIKDAKRAINRLHQIEIYDSVLSVEFAKQSGVDAAGCEQDIDRQPTDSKKAKDQNTQNSKHASNRYCAVAEHLGLRYPSDPGIKYNYPSVNGDILLNICSALAAVPKFYTQLIECLKEKMKFTSSFYDGSIQPAELSNKPDQLEVIEMSESESEYESTDSEGKDKLQALNMNVPERVMNSRKRKAKRTTNPSKLRKLLRNPTAVEVQKDTPRENIEPDAPQCSGEGFGKIQPINLTSKGVNISPLETEDKVTKDFITKSQLSCGRLSTREMNSSSLFEKYKKGDPSCRLYVKNLSKRVTQKDLEFIYGRFVNFGDETDRNMFDIQLLTQGRMKGQAFVGFSSMEAATNALEETNGYQLMNKPMVVHFARSKKPK